MDRNAGDIVGYFNMASSTFNSGRERSSNWYKLDANVQTFLETRARRLLFSDKHIKGVTVRNPAGEEGYLLAIAKVALSAGCHRSPALLPRRCVTPGSLIISVEANV